MAQRKGNNLFLLVAVGLAGVAYMLLRPRTASGPATHPNGTGGGGVAGSPNQVIQYSGGASGLTNFAQQAAANYFRTINV